MSSKYDNMEPVERAFTEVLDNWKEKHGLTDNFDGKLTMIMGRIGSWISANSVIAGVKDVFSATGKDEKPLQVVQIQDLGEMLAKRLVNDELLKGSVKKVVKP